MVIPPALPRNGCVGSTTAQSRPEFHQVNLNLDICEDWKEFEERDMAALLEM